jgi:hypothetical protein
MYLGSKARPAHKAYLLNDTSELIVYAMWDPQRLSPYRTTRAVMGIAQLSSALSSPLLSLCHGYIYMCVCVCGDIYGGLEEHLHIYLPGN